MREYRNRHEAEQDRDLDLRIIYKCDKCGEEREDYPGYNTKGEKCFCGGYFYKAEESCKG